MDMTWSHVCVTPSFTERLVVLFCVAWPFVTLALLRRQGRSPAPVMAMLIPLAVALCGTWLGLTRVMEVMAPYGGRSATAAGIAEALSLLTVAAFSVAGVALASSIRRHRPLLDRRTVIVAVCVLADAYAVLLFAVGVVSRRVTNEGAVAGAIFSAAIALAAGASLVAVLRSKRS